MYQENFCFFCLKPSRQSPAQLFLANWEETWKSSRNNDKKKKRRTRDDEISCSSLWFILIYLDRLGVPPDILKSKNTAALCKFATDLFEAVVSCCNFAQGIARILCRTFPKRVGKTHRIALFPYAAYRWKNAQVTPGTVAFYTGYSRSPAQPWPAYLLENHTG